MESFSSTDYSSGLSRNHDLVAQEEKPRLTINIMPFSTFDYSSSNTLSRKHRLYFFLSLFVASISINLDHGIIPAAIEEIKESYSLSNSKIGGFGGLVYMGTALGALFLSLLINKVNRQKMIIFALLSNGMFVYAFTLHSNFYFLSLIRFLTGFVQALISIYIPVWIDQYGQSNFKTLFMTLFQLSSVSGLMIGYIMTIMAKAYFNSVNSVITILSGL